MFPYTLQDHGSEVDFTRVKQSVREAKSLFLIFIQCLDATARRPGGVASVMTELAKVYIAKGM